MKLNDLFRNYLTRERVVLLVCMGFATMFWLLNRLSTRYKKLMPVRVEYVLPAGKALRFAPPQYIDVTWQGTGWDLISNAKPRIVLMLDTDRIQYFAMRSVVSQQLGNDALGVSPEQINVQLDKAETKLVPLKPNANLTFIKGFDLAGDIILTPSVLRVTGPRSVMDELKYLETDTLKFDQLKDTLLTKAKVSTNLIFELTQNTFDATIPVEQFTEKSLFIPLEVKNAPQQLRIFPNRIKLDCSVALSRYAQLSPNDFAAEVDLKNMDFKSKNNTVTIVLTQQPSFIRKMKFYPQSASFYFEK
jgi:hypothetical protein